MSEADVADACSVTTNAMPRLTASLAITFPGDRDRRPFFYPLLPAIIAGPFGTQPVRAFALQRLTLTSGKRARRRGPG